MSYVNIPPAYYALMRPGTPYHPGGEGWLKANVPGWGENPNVSWPGQQAANGMGADAPSGPKPAFSYVGTAPPSQYYRVGNAPWGSFPQGPAYAIPRPANCPGCAGGIGIKPGVGAYGASSCGDCMVTDGDRCVPCPEGSDLPECDGCVAGTRAAHWYDNPLAGPIAIGVLTAVGTAVALTLLKKSKIPVAA